MSAFSGFGILKLLLLILGGAYLLLALFAALFAERLIFPAPPVGYSDSPDIIKFPYNEKGDAVSMVWLPNPNSRYLVYYHHGNGEDLQGILPRLEGLRQAGFSVLAWDYPGYGTSGGKPSETLIHSIAEKIWQTIPSRFHYPHENIILYGRSLGSGPAIKLAVHHRAAGLVIEGAFTSIFRVGTRINILPWDIFDNLTRIDSIQCPLLVIHGTEDETVPFSHGPKLYQKAPSPKSFTWIQDGRHNDLINLYPDTYYSSVTRFAQSL